MSGSCDAGAVKRDIGRTAFASGRSSPARPPDIAAHAPHRHRRRQRAASRVPAKTTGGPMSFAGRSHPRADHPVSEARRHVSITCRGAVESGDIDEQPEKTARPCVAFSATDRSSRTT
ncbi:hypothetical protein AQ477_19045 [Burkholderia thailandensis]|nr:hypothetical protein AQ477_19045 [Burkholderia thailandensis]KXF57845.1 hypothetical protein AQ476_24140 [Burkholderia thailandensis]PNE77414.1 hypothetical protein A8H37_03380 [Burkholderia thailandensis]